MQLARDVSAYFLLRGDQPPGQVFYPSIAFAQGLLTLAERLLDTSAPGPLGQQREDQQRFYSTQRDAADDLPLIKIPEGILPELDDAARRQLTFTDAPAPKFAPVEHGHSRGVLDREVLRPRAVCNS